MDGSWIEEPATVKEAVRRFFSQRFQEYDFDRPRLDGICFQTIANQHNNMLVARLQR